MQDLEITWPDGVARFSPEDSPVQVGRSSSASIPLTEGSVSRRHLELEWGGAVWTAVDNSTHGTFDTNGVRLASRWTISDDTVVRLGGIKGVLLEFRPSPGDGAGSNGNGSVAGAADSAPPLFSDRRDEVLDLADKPAAAAGSLFNDRPSSIGSVANGAPPLTDFGESPVERPSILADGSSAQSERPSVFAEARPAAPDIRPPSEPTPASVRPEPAPPAPPAAAPLAEADRPVGIGPDAGGSQVPGATGGYPAVRLGPNSTVISDSAIRLSVDGQDYSFLPGAEISVGRDPNCLIHVDEKHSLVSRRHLQLTFEDGHWWIEDFSSKGTFVDNKRLTAPYKAEGAFIANLGDDDAGTPMRVITSGEHRVPRQLNLLAVAALAAIALIPLILLAFLLTRNDTPTTEPDFESAKRSTVMLFGLEGGQGTGFFVDDNLIVTNQHVAVLSPQMLVGVSRETDDPAQIEYATELVANHPYLDIAVLRITNKATMTGGRPQISADPVGNINLPSVTMGDSNDITIGDDVFSTGFPDRLSITSTNDAGELQLPPVAATSGEAASFTIWPGCSNPEFEAFIPLESPPGVACAAEGDVNRGVLRSTFSSGQGASGSAVFRNNEVVAVVYAGDADDPNTSLNITTAAFSEWLQGLIDANP